jgi:two-component system chemotaxis sensor kinase CheA
MQHRVEAFLMESYAQLDRLDQELVMLQEGSADSETLSRVWRGLHTLTDSCGALGFTRLALLTHGGENMMRRLCDGELQLNVEITTALRTLVDAVYQMLSNIEVMGREGETDDTHLRATFTRFEDVSAVPPAPPPPLERPGTPLPTTAQPQPVLAAAQARAISVSDTSIRVDVGLLDALMDQVGELVLVRNRIMQFATLQEDRSVVAAYQRLDLITAALQENVMKTRMQPIGTIWNKLPRVVRDLALECGKKVNVRMDGQETELDRTLLEAIKDPLTHLVRNAVDHGIESPETRRKVGKPEIGALCLRAFHEGGQVNIEIVDDGAGIDPERVAHKAMERNLITVQQAAALSQRDIVNLIFAPGFSTAEKVTNVSGRGVGLDVVKNNIDMINGAIDIQSQVGQGTTIKLKIPLTLAIIPALIVRCAGERYAIPQTSLVELVRLKDAEAHKKIETIYGAALYRRRGNLLPLVYLKRALLLDEATTSYRPEEDDPHAVDIVILQADEQQFGLVVDGVHDTEEIVVKPLGKQLKDIAVFAGATIMGDGKVALILDVMGLAQRAHVVSEQRAAGQVHAATPAEEQERQSQALLLLESAAGERLALPLARVTRLEKIPRAQVERVGHREVVQYWGQIMPLIDIAQTLAGQWALPTHGNCSATETGTLDVVVSTNGDHYVGLVIDRILDIVEDTFTIQALRSRAGVSGTVVVQGQVAELLDLDIIIQTADPVFSEQLPSAQVVG